MSESYVERVARTMHRLFWESVILPKIKALLVTVPVLGWPVVSDVVIYLFEKYVSEPLFNELAAWGVFTSIEWGGDDVYSDYKKEAEKLVQAQSGEVWNEAERRKFKEVAKRLIILHFRK